MDARKITILIAAVGKLGKDFGGGCTDSGTK
jgi:hypothetical protein